ncbi:MAG: LysR substrate-binding domain-containing protein, partial [Bacteroidales bacterium]
LGIIPTVAPYILPSFIKELHLSYPKINLHVSEMRTDMIIEKLSNAEIDLAILATPLEEEHLLEIPLYYEEFIGYVSPLDPLFAKKEIRSKNMPNQHLWVLQEGHCLRNQVLNFCTKNHENFRSLYEAGSIDTLIKIVDTNGGYTIIPELHLAFLNAQQQKNIRPLIAPAVVREISLVFREDFVRERILNMCADIVKQIIPSKMIDPHLKKFAIHL